MLQTFSSEFLPVQLQHIFYGGPANVKSALPGTKSPESKSCSSIKFQKSTWRRKHAEHIPHPIFNSAIGHFPGSINESERQSPQKIFFSSNPDVKKCPRRLPQNTTRYSLLFGGAVTSSTVVSPHFEGKLFLSSGKPAPRYIICMFQREEPNDTGCLLRAGPRLPSFPVPWLLNEAAGTVDVESQRIK